MGDSLLEVSSNESQVSQKERGVMWNLVGVEENVVSMGFVIYEQAGDTLDRKGRKLARFQIFNTGCW